MKKTVSGPNVQSELIKIAKRFSSEKNIFVPCFGDPGKGTNGKKPRCKGVKGEYRHDQLVDFPTMEILSVYLGDDLIAIDIDGKAAKGLFVNLSRNLVDLPQTIYVSSDPVENNRGCYLFRIPESYKGKIQSYSRTIHDSTDKLEFRTGKRYQAISGLHPISGYYYSNTLNISFDDIPELPLEWCDYIYNLNTIVVNSKPELSNTDTSSKIQTIEMILEMLSGCSNHVDVNSYESWIRVGMIFHNVDPEDDGLEAWKRWSLKGENPATDKEFEQKWNSFSDKRNCVTLGSVFFWLRQAATKSESTELTKKLEDAISKAQINLAGKYILEDRDKIIREFKELELTGETLDTAMIRLSQDIYGSANSSMMETLWDLYHCEGVVTPEQKDAYLKSLLQSLKSVDTTETLNVLSDCYIVKVIRDYFIEQEIEEFYIHGIVSFLTCVASILPKGMKLNFNQVATTPPILFTILLGKPARGKNAILNPFINPLIELTMKQDRAFEKEYEANQTERSYFTRMTKPERKAAYLRWCAEHGRVCDDEFNAYQALDEMYPEPQRNHVYAVANYTPERGRSLSGEQRDRGFLICQAELSNLFKTQTRYSKSSGDDVTELLIAYDGDTTLTERQSEKFRKSDRYQLSILSTIQPTVFADHFNAINDGNGFLSRCSVLPLETAIGYKLNEDPENPDVSFIEPIISAFYQDIITSYAGVSWDSPLVMKFTKEAKAIWNQYSIYCNEKAEPFDDVNDGFYAFLRRSPEKVARYILVIQVIYKTCGLIDDIGIVGERVVMDAVIIGNLLVKLAEKVYSVNSEIDTDYIEPVKRTIFEKLIRMASRKEDGRIPITQLQNQQWRKDKEVIKAFFRSAKMLSVLGKKELIEICKDAERYGVGTWNDKEEFFVIDSVLELKSSYKKKIKKTKTDKVAK